MFSAEKNFFIGPYPARTDDLLLVREALWPTELTARMVRRAAPSLYVIGALEMVQDEGFCGGRAVQVQSTSGSRSKTSAVWWMQFWQAKAESLLG